jgi:hypothetical protein
LVSGLAAGTAQAGRGLPGWINLIKIFSHGSPYKEKSWVDDESIEYLF